MDVAIAGGHGSIARLLSRQLADRGDHVRALIRKDEQVDDVRSDGAEPVRSIAWPMIMFTSPLRDHPCSTADAYQCRC